MATRWTWLVGWCCALSIISVLGSRSTAEPAQNDTAPQPTNDKSVNVPARADPATGRTLLYPPIASRNNQEGSVDLEFTLGADGWVHDARVNSSSGYPQLDAAALITVGYWHYLPATRDGVAIPSSHRIRLMFTLNQAGTNSQGEMRPEPQLPTGTSAKDALVDTSHFLLYPQMARRNGERGDVTLNILVRAEGYVSDAQIVQSSGSSQLDSAALISVGFWSVSPAIRAGAAIDSWEVVTLRFAPTLAGADSSAIEFSPNLPPAPGGSATGLISSPGTSTVDSLKTSLDSCLGKGNATLPQKIDGCTSIIQSGALSGKSLSVAYNLRAKAFSAEGDSNRAFADYDQAIRLDPTYADALAHRAREHLHVGQNDAALKDANGAIQISPSSPDGWAYQGDAYYSLGQPDRAIESFAQSIKRDPNWMWPYNDRGELYLERGDYELAIRDFNEVVRVAPTLPIGWDNLCRSQAFTGQLVRALDDCNKALGLDPNFVDSTVKSGHVSAIQNRALVQLLAGRFALAIDDYDKALALTPKSAEVLFGRGIAKLRTGDAAGGTADISAAKAIDSGVGAMFHHLGLS
jgi:TonB family protein